MKTIDTEGRTQFQIDRIAFFSDAVIAIAITLMVLEIKLPPLGTNTTVKQIREQYGSALFIHFVALFVCFATIGNLWMAHHELYKYIFRYNKQLVKLNLYFLLTIVLLPVTISFSFENNNPENLKMFVFFFNLFLCYITYYFMLRIIFHKKNNFSRLASNEEILKMKTSNLAISIIFLMVSVLTLFTTKWFFIPCLLWPVLKIMKKNLGHQQN